MLRALALLALLAGAARGQAITWRYTDDLTPTCPSALGQPKLDSPAGFNCFLSDPAGAVTLQWQLFTPGAGVMLVLSVDQSRTYYPPCMLVPPDVWLVSSAAGTYGQCRFMLTVPTQLPLSVVPLGVTLMAIGQVVELAAAPLPPVMVSSYVITIEAMR